VTSFRRMTVLLVVLTIALGAGAAAWLTAGAGAAVPTARLTPPGPQPNGVDFSLHSDLDSNFCLEDTPAPQDAASEASMSQCVLRNGQLWTFADASDGSVVIIGGNTGKCLDFTAKPVSLVSMTPCTFAFAEHFFYSPTGQIESTGGGKCLEPAQAEQNALVSIVKCKTGVKAQIWTIGH
jgi:hypothetical protein